MTDEFTRMFKAMMEQGQEMARAFNPALETFQVKGFETFTLQVKRHAGDLIRGLAL